MLHQTLARALTLATMLSLVLASIATADTVTNNLDATVDATLETMSLSAGGMAGSTTMRLIVNDNATDPVNGCNLGGAGMQVTFGVKSSNTAVATVSPSTIQFTNCDPSPGSTAIVTVTPAAGVIGTQSATISLSNLATDGASLTTNKAATLANFNVDPARFTVNVTAATKTTPTITWAAPAAIPYGTALSGTQLNATASVPGSLVYSPAAGTVLGVGTHTLQADFTPTDTTSYNSTSKTVSVTVIRAEQATLTVTGMPSVAQAYSASFTVGTAGGSGTGAVTFSAAGACSNAGADITITAGSGVCSVTATKAADANYNATTSAPATVDAKKATATLILTDLNQTYDGSPKLATVTTVPGGLTVMVTYDDNEPPPINAGSYSVLATVVDDNYEGTASGTLEIAKADQTIDFGALPNKTFGDAAFNVSATATSGLTVTFSAAPAANCLVSGTTVTIGNAGSCTVTAAQAGDDNWNPAPSVNQMFTIAKAAGSVSISNIPSSAVFGGSFTPAYTKAGDGTPSATSLTTGTCAVASDGTVSYVGAGLCTLQASVTEGTNHLAATGASQSFTIAKAAGSVSITNLPSSPLLNASFTPAFSKLGDGATSVTSMTPTQCSADATTGVVTFIGVGTCTLNANVAEGTNHLAASATYTLQARYVFTGFDRPVDNNGVLNIVKAGQAVPLKFRLTDANGTGVTTLTSVTVTVASLNCTAGTTADELEEYAAGSSGLQNLGGGYYQFNWKTPTNYANSCKTLRVALGDGAAATPYTALFQFRK